MQISVKLTRLKSAVNNLSSIEKKLNYDLERVEVIVHTLRTIDNEALREVADKLRIQRDNIKVDANRVQYLKKALEQIIQCYGSTEEKVMSYEPIIFHAFKSPDIQPFKPVVIRPGIIDAGVLFK